jgi:lysine 2,3-aminomutase
VDTHDKVSYRPSKERWGPAFAYIASRPEVEDVVLSGGDLYMLAPGHLDHILEVLLSIPHVRRIRLATKGPAVMPMKILTHNEWTDTVIRMAAKGRELNKEVCLHTHFNSPNEITEISREALAHLFTNGVIVRNQSVLIRGVNDDPEVMIPFVRQLAFMNVQPYYVYQHDMVKHVEELRTTVGQTIELERRVRGSTAGFNTPTFVNDVPGGGGKRDIHSLEVYDETTGISVYRSPAVDEDRVFLYFDPVHLLPREGRDRWADEEEWPLMVQEALEAAGMEDKTLATDVIPVPSHVSGD